MNETLPYKIYPKLHNPTKTQDCVVVVLHCSYFCSNCNYNKWQVAEHKQSVQRPVVINWTPGQPQCDNLWECSELLSETRGGVCLQAYDWLGVPQLSYCIVIVSSVNTRPGAENSLNASLSSFKQQEWEATKTRQSWVM